jgi:hypothetical protein
VALVLHPIVIKDLLLSREVSAYEMLLVGITVDVADDFILELRVRGGGIAGIGSQMTGNIPLLGEIANVSEFEDEDDGNIENDGVRDSSPFAKLLAIDGMPAPSQSFGLVDANQIMKPFAQVAIVCATKTPVQHEVLPQLHRHYLVVII